MYFIYTAYWKTWTELAEIKIWPAQTLNKAMYSMFFAQLGPTNSPFALYSIATDPGQCYEDSSGWGLHGKNVYVGILWDDNYILKPLFCSYCIFLLMFTAKTR